jgi:hypothetical protein
VSLPLAYLDNPRARGRGRAWGPVPWRDITRKAQARQPKSRPSPLVVPDDGSRYPAGCSQARADAYSGKHRSKGSNAPLTTTNISSGVSLLLWRFCWPYYRHGALIGPTTAHFGGPDSVELDWAVTRLQGLRRLMLPELRSAAAKDPCL